MASAGAHTDERCRQPAFLPGPPPTEVESGSGSASAKVSAAPSRAEPRRAAPCRTGQRRAVPVPRCRCRAMPSRSEPRRLRRPPARPPAVPTRVARGTPRAGPRRVARRRLASRAAGVRGSPGGIPARVLPDASVVLNAGPRTPRTWRGDDGGGSAARPLRAPLRAGGGAGRSRVGGGRQQRACAGSRDRAWAGLAVGPGLCEVAALRGPPALRGAILEAGRRGGAARGRDGPFRGSESGGDR